MPGINANLSNAAFAIWEEVPRKTRKSPLGGAGEPGRSKWLSSVIIEHHQGKERRAREVAANADKLAKALEKLRIMTECRDALQAHVLETP